MLAVLCDQSNGYEVTMIGYQVRRMIETRNMIFCLQPWEASPSAKAEAQMLTKLIASSQSSTQLENPNIGLNVELGFPQLEKITFLFPVIFCLDNHLQLIYNYHFDCKLN